MFPFGFQVLQQSHDSTSSILSLSVSQHLGFPLPNGPIGPIGGVGIANIMDISWIIMAYLYLELSKSCEKCARYVHGQCMPMC